jgi:DNA mismatch repair protein MutL
VGTTIEVRNLFFNTPVRRKFMRAVQTEIGHASEAFTRIALAHPQVHFTLRHNDRQVFDLPPVATWRERIAAFFGREIEAALIPLDNTDGGVRLVWVIDPERKVVTTYRELLRPCHLGSTETLEGDDVLPGLSIPLEALFPR